MNLTLMSKNEYRHIADSCMTADEAFEYMSRTLPLRTFGEVLEQFAGDMDLKRILTDALCEYSPHISRDSVSRKVRGWLSGKYEPSDRETYLQICFALKLDEEKARDFLGCCSDCGFHYRNPRELTYSFALRAGMNYSDAVELYNSLPTLPGESVDEPVYTEQIYNEFYKISTVDGFKSFYADNINKLGVLHNTAYKYFATFMQCLRDPDVSRRALFGDGAGASERFSVEQITDKYLRMNVPSGRASGKYTYIQKMIKKYWPCATSIKNMLNRAEDVTRKTLILLYLITEGIAPEVNYDFVLGDELTPAERFGEHYDRLCIMLTDCAMALPDPRNVFDWAVLYAVKMNNSEEIRDEMQTLMSRIFAERNLTD